MVPEGIKRYKIQSCPSGDFEMINEPQVEEGIKEGHIWSFIKLNSDIVTSKNT